MMRGDSSLARAALRATMVAFYEETSRAVQTGARVAELAARQTDRWKGRSGETRKSIRFATFSKGADVGFKLLGAGASRFLESGTRPHVITTTHARALRFVLNGEVVYRKFVNHPGTKPTYYLRRAVSEGALAVERALPGLLALAARRHGLGR